MIAPVRALFCGPFQDLPLDVLPLILEHLEMRRDLHACSLVSKAFSRFATPYLYRALDSMVISKTLIHHPCWTILQRPNLARYVRQVTETGAIHRGIRYPNITRDTLAALSLCKNLRSFIWIDHSPGSEATLLAFIDAIRTLPVRELTIRTHSKLGETFWSQLMTLTELHKVAIWCTEGPPQDIQGWSWPLGNTLTHLDLGVSTFLFPCSELLSQLPHLRDLRLKGASSTSIPSILSHLPELETLDTEYLLSSPRNLNFRRCTSPPPPVDTSSTDKLKEVRVCQETEPVDICDPSSFPILKHLTVRAKSLDNRSPQKVWDWIRELVPSPGLETFRLHAYLYPFNSNHGDACVPRSFILDLASMHGSTLVCFDVGEMQLTLEDIECICTKFPNLQTFECSLALPDMAFVGGAISGATNLKMLKLHVKTEWMSNGMRRPTPFTLEDALGMMLRSENSRLRMIAVDRLQYTGNWVLDDAAGDGELKPRFKVSTDIFEDHWQT